MAYFLSPENVSQLTICAHQRLPGKAFTGYRHSWEIETGGALLYRLHGHEFYSSKGQIIGHITQGAISHDLVINKRHFPPENIKRDGSIFSPVGRLTVSGLTLRLFTEFRNADVGRRAAGRSDIADDLSLLDMGARSDPLAMRDMWA